MKPSEVFFLFFYRCCFLTDEESSVHVRIFAQQLFTDVHSWIVLILNAQQDLVLKHKHLQSYTHNLSEGAFWVSCVQSARAKDGRRGAISRRGRGHLGVIQCEEGLQVGDQVWVNALQRLQQ